MGYLLIQVIHNKLKNNYTVNKTHQPTFEKASANYSLILTNIRNEYKKEASKEYEYLMESGFFKDLAPFNQYIKQKYKPIIDQQNEKIKIYYNHEKETGLAYINLKNQEHYLNILKLKPDKIQSFYVEINNHYMNIQLLNEQIINSIQTQKKPLFSKAELFVRKNDRNIN